MVNLIILHKCYLAKKNNTEFIIKGSGKPLRQFIYSQDVAILILNILENYNLVDNLILSINPENELSIKELVKINTRLKLVKNKITGWFLLEK